MQKLSQKKMQHANRNISIETKSFRIYFHVKRSDNGKEIIDGKFLFRISKGFFFVSLLCDDSFKALPRTDNTTRGITLLSGVEFRCNFPHLVFREGMKRFLHKRSCCIYYMQHFL